MQLIDGNKLLDENGVDYFKQAAVFGALSEQAIEYLLTKGSVYALEKGEFLFKAGTRGDSFFVMLKGSIAYYKYHQDQYRHIHDFHFGEPIGFVSMLALQRRPGKTIATTDCCVVEISSDLFYALHCDNSQDFGLLMMNLSREMARIIIEFSNILVEDVSTNLISPYKE